MTVFYVDNTFPAISLESIIEGSSIYIVNNL